MSAVSRREGLAAAGLEMSKNDSLQLRMKVCLGLFKKQELSSNVLLIRATAENFQQHADVQGVVKAETISSRLCVRQSPTG